MDIKTSVTFRIIEARRDFVATHTEPPTKLTLGYNEYTELRAFVKRVFGVTEFPLCYGLQIITSLAPNKLEVS